MSAGGVFESPGRGAQRTVAGLMLAIAVLPYVDNVMALALGCGGLVALHLSASSASSAVSLMLAGTSTLGAVVRAGGIERFGTAGALIVAIAVGLRAWSKERDRLVVRWMAIFWLLWVCAVVVLAYFAGPMSEYASGKVALFTLNLATSFVGFVVLAKFRRAQIGDVGLLLMASAVVQMAATKVTFPGLRIDSALGFAALRMPGSYGANVTGIPYLAGLGVVMWMLSWVAGKRQPYARAGIAAILFATTVVLVGFGTRLPFVGIALAMLVLLFAHRSTRKRALLLSFVVAIGLAAIIIRGSENERLTGLFDSSRTVAERVERSYNWEAAMLLIKQNPWRGHGLGGYFVPSFILTNNTGATYPHNLVLELLVEMGILGVVALILPLLLAVGHRWWLSNSVEVPTWAGVLAVYLLLGALSSRDLAHNAPVFGLAAVVILNSSRGSEPSRERAI